MINKHLLEIIIDLFVTIVGGVMAYYLTNDSVTTNNLNVISKIREADSYSNLNLKIKDINVLGSSKILSYIYHQTIKFI